MGENLKNNIVLWLSIAIMASSGTLGRYIHLAPEVTIWVRCVIGAAALYVVLLGLKENIKIGLGKGLRIIFFASLFLGVHWVTYFYSLKLTSVAIGMLSLFIYPVVAAVLEPWMFGYKHRLVDIFVSIFTFIGVCFLVPIDDLGSNIGVGVLLGVISAFAYSLRNLVVKKGLVEYSGITVMFYQLLILAVVMIPVVFINGLSINITAISDDIRPLLVLGLLTTAGGHTLFVLSLKHFSVTTVSILSCLTPVLGILIGYFVLDEIPQGKVLIGGAIIMSSVVFESLKSLNKKETV